MLFNNADASLFGDLLNQFRSQNNPTFNAGNVSPNSFLIAGTKPGNKYYSLNETDELRKKRFGNQYPPLTPIQYMRRGINDALINVGNMFGQDFSGSGPAMGEVYYRQDYK